MRIALIVFWKDNGPGMAGTVAFFGFLSVVPLVLLLLAIFGEFVSRSISAHEVRSLFHGLIPGLSQKQFLNTYWKPIRHSHASATILGIISLIIGTLGLHDSVDWGGEPHLGRAGRSSFLD